MNELLDQKCVHIQDDDAPVLWCAAYVIYILFLAAIFWGGWRAVVWFANTYIGGG